MASLLFWAGVLACFSLMPEGASPAGVRIWDKFSHFAAYAVLALMLVGVVNDWRESLPRVLAVCWLLCFGYGLLLELLQWGMALGRQFEVGDLVANGLGALAGCAIFCRRPGR